MDNLELINQGTEGGVGFCLSVLLSSHFLSNTEPSHSALQAFVKRDRNGLTEAVEREKKKAFEYFLI